MLGAIAFYARHGIGTGRDERGTLVRIFGFSFSGRRVKPQSEGTTVTLSEREIVREDGETISDHETIRRTELTVTPAENGERAETSSEPEPNTPARPLADASAQPDTGALAAIGAFLKTALGRVGAVMDTKWLCVRIQQDAVRHMEICVTQQSSLHSHEGHSPVVMRDANVKLYALRRDLLNDVLVYCKALGYDSIPSLASSAPGSLIPFDTVSKPNSGASPADASRGASRGPGSAMTSDAWSKAHRRATASGLADEFQRVLQGVTKARKEADPLSDVRREDVTEIVYELYALASGINADMQHQPRPEPRRVGFLRFPGYGKRRSRET